LAGKEADSSRALGLDREKHPPTPTPHPHPPTGISSLPTLLPALLSTKAGMALNSRQGRATGTGWVRAWQWQRRAGSRWCHAAWGGWVGWGGGRAGHGMASRAPVRGGIRRQQNHMILWMWGTKQGNERFPCTRTVTWHDDNQQAHGSKQTCLSFPS
jgi:hypothetical protein